VTKPVTGKNEGMDTSSVIERAILQITEGPTGAISSQRSDYFLPLGYAVQRHRSRERLQTLLEEWEVYRAKGLIKDDYTQSEQHKECLQEMLDFLDRDSPDEIRFTVLKKILLTAATEEISTRESVLPQQYMRVCRGLTSGEILVLLTTYTTAESSALPGGHTSADKWLEIIAERSGLKHPELVEIHERSLIEKNLLTPRKYFDGSGIDPGHYFRLTNLAYDICKFIELYERSTDN
jgi:hypothetical protein